MHHMHHCNERCRCFLQRDDFNVLAHVIKLVDSPKHANSFYCYVAVVVIASMMTLTRQ